MLAVNEGFVAGVSLENRCELLRALHEPFYDPENNRASTSAFERIDVSVSALDLLSYDEIVLIFKRDLNNETRTVTGVARMSAGDIRRACDSIEDRKNDVDVIYDPITPAENELGNPAHCLIQAFPIGGPRESKKLTKGMARKILDICQFVPLENSSIDEVQAEAEQSPR